MGGDVEVASGGPIGDSRAAFARTGTSLFYPFRPPLTARSYLDDSAGASFFTGFCSV